MSLIPPAVSVWSRIALGDVTTPRGIVERIRVFGPDRHQYALVCLPAEDEPARPWVYFLYGGGWQGGSPREYAFAGRHLAARGFPTVLGGYRHAPAARWPAQLHDAFAGLDEVVAEERSLGDRPLVLGGFSAGGQLAAMMALGVEGERPAHLAGLLAMAAPLDLSLYPASPLIEGLTGHAGPWPEADPATHLAAPLPPTLLPHGVRDDTVPLASSVRFADAANRLAPGTAEVLELKGAGHVDILRLLLEDLPESRALLAWLEARG